MEFYEYLRKAGFEVKSSAKDIRKVAESLRNEPGSFRKYLTRLKYAIDDNGETAETWDAAKNWLKDHAEDLKNDLKFEYDENTNGIADMLDKIADEKESLKKKIKEETAAMAPVTADYTIPGLDKSKEPLELFTSVPVIKPNKHDKDLMHCFAILGDAVVFRANGKCCRLMTRTANGKPQIVFAAGDTGADGLYSEISAALSMKYTRYMNLLQEKLATLPEYPENNETHPIEDIFLNEVPTILRHIVDVRKNYKTKTDDKGDKHTFFHGYKAYAKKNAVPELTVDAFVDWLSQHWITSTRGILDQAPTYKVLSNDPSEMAVNRFIIWPKEVWEKAVIPESWDNVFGAKLSARLFERMCYFIGGLLDADNRAQQYLAISDPGQTGKGLLVELLSQVLENLIGTSMKVHLDNSALTDGDRFGLSATHVWNYRWGVVNEYDGKSLNSGVGKSIVGGDTKPLEVKNLDSIQWDTKQFRFIVPSNHGFVLMSHSVRRRCIPLTFKQTHCSIDNMNDEDRQVLIDDGEQFLQYCWRVYQTSKFRQRDGGYFVACPEDEKLFLEGKFLVDRGKVNSKTGKPILEPVYDDKLRMLRAFSRDPEIAAFYTVDDYDDTEMTCSFNKFIDKYCDKANSDDDEYMMPYDLFKELVTTYCDVDDEIYETFGDCIKVQRRGYGHEDVKTFNYNASPYRIFKKYMENHGHKMEHLSEGNVFVRIRIKPQYMVNGQLRQPDTNKANTSFSKGSSPSQYFGQKAVKKDYIGEPFDTDEMVESPELGV